MFSFTYYYFLHKDTSFSYNNIRHTSFTDSHNNNLSFISNNVKVLQTTSKRIKIFEYLKNYATSIGFIFLQETHSSVKDEKIWNEFEFEGQLFFSLGKTNSCGVAIAFVGIKALNILNIRRDNLGRH